MHKHVRNYLIGLKIRWTGVIDSQLIGLNKKSYTKSKNWCNSKPVLKIWLWTLTKRPTTTTSSTKLIFVNQIQDHRCLRWQKTIHNLNGPFRWHKLKKSLKGFVKLSSNSKKMTAARYSCFPKNTSPSATSSQSKSLKQFGIKNQFSFKRNYCSFYKKFSKTRRILIK